MGERAMAIVPGSSEQIRNDDVSHPFRQDSSFFYLTGFAEPDTVAVLLPGHPETPFVLFVRPRDPERETWDGYRAGVEGAQERHGADAAYDIAELDAVLPRLMLGREEIWYSPGNSSHDGRIGDLVIKARQHQTRFGGIAPVAVRDLARPLAELRLRKSPDEVESMRAVCLLTAEGHREAMKFTSPGLYEYQVQAALEFPWRDGGSLRDGYPSIVASGANTCILHYVDNDRLIEDGDLVLIDAGAEIDGYSADITRTFPANGRFTPAQRAIYDVVLAAERAGIETVEPGANLRQVYDNSTRVLVEGMVELGLLPRSVDESIAMKHYRQYFMHGSSHWLGLDVHDAGGYRTEDGAFRPLEPGMCFTVEPGLYVAPQKDQVELALLEYDLDDWAERRILLGTAAAQAEEAKELEEAEKVIHEVPAEFLGIGVRLEDDILVTEDGYMDLSSAVPVDPDEVEALCAEVSWLSR